MSEAGHMMHMTLHLIAVSIGLAALVMAAFAFNRAMTAHARAREIKEDLEAAERRGLQRRDEDMPNPSRRTMWSG